MENSVINLNSCSINHKIEVSNSTLEINSSNAQNVDLKNGSAGKISSSDLSELNIETDNNSTAIVSTVKSSNFNVKAKDGCNINEVQQNSGDVKFFSKNYDERLIEKFQSLSDILQHCYNTDVSGICGVCGSGGPSHVPKGYIFGGFSGSDGQPSYSIMDDIDEYDENGDLWSSKSNLLSPARDYTSAFYISTKGYIVGGRGGYHTLDDTIEYTPEIDSCILRGNMVHDRQDGTAFSINNKGYYSGGFGSDSSNQSNTNFEYDVAGDSWVTKHTIPYPARRELRSSTINNKGYLFSGFNMSLHYLRDTEEYNPLNDTWVSKTDHNSPGRGLNAASPFDNKSYIIGGDTGSSYINDVDEYEPGGDTWVSKTNYPTIIGRQVSNNLSNGICVFGGENSSTIVRDVYEFNNNSWTSKASLPSPSRANASGTPI